MSVIWRQNREAELRALSHANPARLVGMFRAISGLDELRQLPLSVSFTSMIEAILDHEQKDETVQNAEGFAP